MNLFWIPATGMVLLALAVIAVALLRKPRAVATASPTSNLQLLKAQMAQLDADLAAGSLDAAQHGPARAELARRMLDEEAAAAAAPLHAGSSGTTLLLLAVAVPVVAVLLYAHLGNPQALGAAGTHATQAEPSQQELEAMVAKLAERMAQKPPGRAEDLEGWVMLGRSYAVMQRFPEAGRAYARALELAPDNAQLLADQADVLAMVQGQSLEGQPWQLIERALKADPSNVKALALAGSAAFQRKDFAGAVRYWERARAVVPPDSEVAQGLQRSIAEARSLGGGSGVAAAPATALASPGPAAAPAITAQGEARISGRLSLAPALAARVSPGDVVYVFARAVDGPRVPLAIVKRSAAELPFDFTLDDSSAMSPELKLSAHPQVIVGARIAKGGDAMPKAGDLEGQMGPLASRGGGRVEVLIDRVRP